MSSELAHPSQCYLASINNLPVGFIAILHFPHPSSDKIKRVHRLVVLPDYQGVGIGNRLLEYIGKYYIDKGYRYTITTSTPALIYYFQKKKYWILKNYGRNRGHRGEISTSKVWTSPSKRFTTGWEMIK